MQYKIDATKQIKFNFTVFTVWPRRSYTLLQIVIQTYQWNINVMENAKLVPLIVCLCYVMSYHTFLSVKTKPCYLLWHFLVLALLQVSYSNDILSLSNITCMCIEWAFLTNSILSLCILPLIAYTLHRTAPTALHTTHCSFSLAD